MSEIYAPNDNFNFNKINLLTPVNQNGSYFIKFRVNDNPLYIQPPKCKTKQGIFKSGKKIHCDLLYTNENEQFVRWIENLEIYCRKIMFENREKWFETVLDENDIETYFTSPFKVVKSGKFYLMRVNVPSLLGNCALKAYNENGEEIEIESIKENMEIMNVLEIQGIKCSARNFQIEMEIKQIMLLNNSNIFEKCIFNTKKLDYEEKSSQKVPENLNKESISNSLVNNFTETSDENLPILENKDENITFESLNREDEVDLSKSENLESGIIQIEEFTEKSEVESLSKNTDKNSNYEKDIINDGIIEVDFDLDKLSNSEIVEVKEQKDIYYEMYVEAKRKAKIARDLAISSYLEAKKIKNIYMIQDSDSDIDLDSDEFIKTMNV